MAITTSDGLVAAMAASTRKGITFYRLTQTSKGAGLVHSLFLASGFPGPGATPSTGAGDNPLRTTAGSLVITNPSGGNKLYLASFSAQASTVGGLRLYDRLWQNSGLSGTTLTSQTINSTAWTRGDLTGDGVELWGEVYSAFGSTAQTLTVTYTNQAGTGSRSATYASPSAPVAGQMFPLTLQSGDTGVRSVQSAIWGASTGTAGNFGLVLLRPIAEISMGITSVGNLKDVFQVGMQEISADACLALQVFCSTTSTGFISGMVHTIEG